MGAHSHLPTARHTACISPALHFSPQVAVCWLLQPLICWCSQPVCAGDRRPHDAVPEPGALAAPHGTPLRAHSSLGCVSLPHSCMALCRRCVNLQKHNPAAAPAAALDLAPACGPSFPRQAGSPSDAAAGGWARRARGGLRGSASEALWRAVVCRRWVARRGGQPIRAAAAAESEANVAITWTEHERARATVPPGSLNTPQQQRMLFQRTQPNPFPSMLSSLAHKHQSVLHCTPVVPCIVVVSCALTLPT